MTVLRGESELRALADAALVASGADETEVYLEARTNALTRYANAFIHQNVVSTEARVRVRAVKGKRVAVISSDRLDREGVTKAAHDASELAALVPENPRFTGLVDKAAVPASPQSFFDRTAAATPEARAQAVKRICDPARAKGLSAAGYVQTKIEETLIANSRGVSSYWPRTVADLEVVGIGATGSAYAERASADFGALDIAGAAEEAIGKTLIAQDPRDIEPGEYEVLLAPYAVVDIVNFLGNQLTGPAVEEGRSFVGGRIGQKVTGPVTLVDDPFDPECLPMPFDYEGAPSSRVTLIEDGIARGVVYDSQSAARAGVPNTGHALPTNPFAQVMPMHLRLEAGDQTRHQLMGAMKRGLLVTRFHYTRWVHQLRTIVTGMTREGTFLIEDGQIAHPVKTLRFTQSYHEALAGTLGISSDLTLIPSGFGPTARRVPALRLASFTFTGATRY